MIGRFLQNAPLARKVRVLIVVSASLALLSASVGVSVGHAYQARADLRSSLVTLADVIGKNSAGALTFDDKDQAARVLTTLGNQVHIEDAAVFGIDGAQMARMDDSKRADTLMLDNLSPTSNWQRVEVVEPVMFAGESIGTIYLRSSLDPVFESLYRSASGTAMALAIGAVIAILLASLLTPAL
ncbi:MAG: CHASE sensor domain-containing protein, partial [Pseudomonadota bacterium]